MSASPVRQHENGEEEEEEEGGGGPPGEEGNNKLSEGTRTQVSSVSILSNKLHVLGEGREEAGWAGTGGGG